MTTETTKANIITSVKSVALDKEFIKLEEGIRTASKSFIILGNNMVVINAGEFYKQRGFGTWDSYVTTMFDFTRDYSYKMMNAARVYNLLKDSKSFKPIELPKTETQCRPLTKIDDDEDVIKIWSAVIGTGKVIAKTVTEKVDIFLGKSTPTPKPEPTEDTGNSITSPTVSDNNEADNIPAVDEVRVLKARVTELENELEKARSTSGKLISTKLGRQIVQAGFAALHNTATDDQKAELIATKKALLG